MGVGRDLRDHGQQLAHGFPVPALPQVEVPEPFVAGSEGGVRLDRRAVTGLGHLPLLPPLGVDRPLQQLAGLAAALGRHAPRCRLQGHGRLDQITVEDIDRPFYRLVSRGLGSDDTRATLDRLRHRARAGDLAIDGHCRALGKGDHSQLRG